MRRKSARKLPQKSQALRERKAERDGIPWPNKLLAAVALCFIALLAYSDSFHGGFVFDNQTLILQDPRVSQATANNLELILQHTYWWPTGESGLYRPVTTLSYLFNYAVLGENNHPAGYHWFNFSFHALNCLLIFALALRFLRKLLPSALIAGLWAVHPVLTESVTNIIGRSDLLAAAALLSGFLFYLKSAESRGWTRFAWLAGLTAVTFVGVFSKESAVAILGIIALFEFTWWKERRQLRGFALGCLAIAPALLALFYQRSVVLADSYATLTSFVDNPLIGAQFVTAKLTSIAVMARYLWLLVWPVMLSCDYSYNAIPLASGNWHDWISWIVVAVAIALVGWQYSRNKLLFFFAAFAFVTFIPVSNLLFSTGTIMAERFLYLPAAGFFACLVLVIYSAAQRSGSRAVAPVVLCLLIATLGIRTWKRNLDWRDEFTLWKSAAQTVPSAYKGHEGFAAQLFQSDPTHSNINRVIEEEEKSLAILAPLPDGLNYGDAFADAGTYYIVKGQLLASSGLGGKPADTPASVQAYEKAQQVLKRAAAIDKAYFNAYVEMERPRGKSASEIPLTGVPTTYATLSENSMRLGDQQTALDAAIYAHQLDPTNVSAYPAIASILVAQDRVADAADMLVEAQLVSGGDQRILEMLRTLYHAGLDPKGCAITQAANGASINNMCEPVHGEICRASADLAAIFRRGRPDLVDQTKEEAREYGCSADLLH